MTTTVDYEEGNDYDDSDNDDDWEKMKFFFFFSCNVSGALQNNSETIVLDLDHTHNLSLFHTQS
jgi:hypothetical protein